MLALHKIPKLRESNIIIEGMDCTGKTALARRLATDLGMTYIDTDYMNCDYGKITGNPTEPYFDGINLATLQFLKSINNCIKTRYAWTEAVYANIYNRDSRLNSQELEAPIIDKTITILVECDYQVYIKRSSEYRPEERLFNSKEFELQQNLFRFCYRGSDSINKGIVQNNGSFESAVTKALFIISVCLSGNLIKTNADN